MEECLTLLTYCKQMKAKKLVDGIRNCVWIGLSSQIPVTVRPVNKFMVHR